ncbi:MAG: TonB-dependent siderophore receptor [Hyphomonadaceae bacterium]|nr:TonB-dependent siderophore receptor [Hyphomonadaceae bacterium]
MKFQTRLLGAAAICAIISPALALADTPDDDEYVQDEIVVIGQYLYTDQVNALKSPTPVIDVPQSLSIVTADQILQQGFNSIGDIINYTPGVNTSQGEGHRDAIVFRGVRSTADFFIDGVRDDVQYYRPLYNLEQVEILRGPNALLFGRGGTGGILNRVTKKADLDETFTGYQASLDSFGAFGAQIDSNFILNDSSAFRLNAMYESLENHRDFYDGERFGINPTARFQLAPLTTLDVSYEYVDHERFIDRGIPTGANGEPVEAFEDIVFGDPELNTTTLEAHLFRAMLQHRFSDNLKGRFSAFYGDYDKFYENFYASAFDPTTNIVGIDGYVDTTQRQNLILSGDLIGEFQTGRIGHTIVSGVEYIDTQNDNDRFNPVWSGSNDDVEFFNVMRPLSFSGGVGINASGNPTTVAFSDFNDDTAAELQVFSAYIQDEIEISDQLDVIIGARFDSFDITVDNLDPANLETRSRTDEEISPRFGLVYKPVENVSFYGSYSESFLPRSGEQFANINGDANRLDPDTFTNLEAGVKWDFVPGVSFTAAVFEIEQESPVVSDTDAERLDIIKTTVDGFEVQLQGQVTEQWFVSAGYSYLDGAQADGTLRPRELPENMFSLWNAYQVTDRFGLGLGLTYQDESFINNSNTAVLPSYTRVDAAAYYDVSEDLRLQLNIENLTDELYFPDSHSTHQATVGAPLNAKITISGRF